MTRALNGLHQPCVPHAHLTKHPCRLAGTCGMTLVEVVIACMILGMSLSAFLMGFTADQKTAAFANNRFQAINMAREGMETTTSLRYDSAALSVGSHAFSSNTTYVVVESNNVKDITMTVRWIDPTRSATSSLSIVASMARAVHK